MKSGRLREGKPFVQGCTFNGGRAKIQPGFPNFPSSPLNSHTGPHVARAQCVFPFSTAHVLRTLWAFFFF